MKKSKSTEDLIRESSREFSFNVVTYSIQLEEIMTNIICLELSKDWLEMESFEDYFDKVSFENKINLAETILKNNHPKTLKKFPKIFANVRQVKKIRNQLAHRNRHYEVNPQGKNAKFVLHHRKIKKQIRLSEKEMTKQIEKIEKCLNDMHKVQDLFAKDFGYKGIV